MWRQASATSPGSPRESYMALRRWRVTPVASLMAAEMMLPPTFSSRPSCSGAILPHVRYAAGSRSSANHSTRVRISGMMLILHVLLLDAIPTH